MSTQTETQTEAAPQQITINDIALMANIINIVARRGAFEAAEFTVIGGFFEKLKALLPESTAEEPNPTETGNTGATEEEIPSNQLNFDFAGNSNQG